MYVYNVYVYYTYALLNKHDAQIKTETYLFTSHKNNVRRITCNFLKMFLKKFLKPFSNQNKS